MLIHGVTLSEQPIAQGQPNVKRFGRKLMMPEMMTPKSLGNPATEVCPPMYFFRQENIAAKAHKNGWP